MRKKYNLMYVIAIVVIIFGAFWVNMNNLWVNANNLWVNMNNRWVNASSMKKPRKTQKNPNECDCDKEGFSLRQSRNMNNQISTGGKSMVAIKSSVKNKLKSVKNNFIGFKNYINVNYYYDQIHNLL